MLYSVEIRAFCDINGKSVYIAKSAYFNTKKGIKINRLLPDDLNPNLNFASTGSTVQEKI